MHTYVRHLSGVFNCICYDFYYKCIFCLLLKQKHSDGTAVTLKELDDRLTKMSTLDTSVLEDAGKGHEINQPCICISEVTVISCYWNLVLQSIYTE